MKDPRLVHGLNFSVLDLGTDDHQEFSEKGLLRHLMWSHDEYLLRARWAHFQNGRRVLEWRIRTPLVAEPYHVEFPTHLAREMLEVSCSHDVLEAVLCVSESLDVLQEVARQFGEKDAAWIELNPNAWAKSHWATLSR